MVLFIFSAGVLLDDLLVAEDLAAAETTTAALHSAAAASHVQPGQVHERYGFVSEKERQPMAVGHPDGAVVLGNPVAAPVNGDMHPDISTDNAVLQLTR